MTSRRRGRKERFVSEYKDPISYGSDNEDSKLSEEREVDLGDAESSGLDERGLVSLHFAKAMNGVTYCKNIIDVVVPYELK